MRPGQVPRPQVPGLPAPITVAAVLFAALLQATVAST